MRARGLVLVGPRGAGKSSVGAEIARRIGLSFLDLDREVERRTGRSVAEMLADSTFRREEAETLRQALAGPPAVLAAGGGAVLWDGFPAASRNWTVVWLDADPAVLAERIRRDTAVRPSLTGRPPDEEIAGIAAQREPLYRAVSSMRIDTSSRSVSEVATEICGKLFPDLGSPDRIAE